MADADGMEGREVLLANGDRVALGVAVRQCGRLTAALQSNEAEWDIVYHLREVCLGQVIEPEAERFLIHEGYLGRDGAVDPALRSVVLAAVRGEGRVLRVESPYVDPLDRARAEFLGAREQLLAQLDPAERAAVFDKPPLERHLDALRETFGGTPQPTPGEQRSFLKKLKDRLDQDHPPSPPPPR